METTKNIQSIEAHPLAMELMEALKEVAQYDCAIAAQEEHLGYCSATLTLNVLEAKGADGKPAYSNDTARKAAAELAVGSDDVCKDVIEGLLHDRLKRSEALARVEAIKLAGRLAVATLEAAK